MHQLENLQKNSRHYIHRRICLLTMQDLFLLTDRKITVNCCHPGAVATNMGVSRDTGFGKTIMAMLKPFFLTPEEGARTAIFLATDDSVRDITGEYFYKCKIAKSSKASKDMDVANRLYEMSAKMTCF